MKKFIAKAGVWLAGVAIMVAVQLAVTDGLNKAFDTIEERIS